VRTTESRSWPRWAEALLLVVVTLLSVQEAYIGGSADLVSPGVGLAAVASLALALRYRHPAIPAVLAVSTAAVLGIPFPLLVVIFTLASRGRLAASVLSGVAAMAGNWVLEPEHHLWEVRLSGPVLPLAVALATGMWADSRRRLVATLAEQVDQLGVERELRAERARLSERARIAAEMHDVLAHRLSVLALHAGALQRRAAGLPAPVADRIDLLRSTSTEALGDLRDVLGALRDPSRPEPDGSPLSGLRPLPAVLDEARKAGQVVDAVLGGDPGATPVSHRLAVHRVVQEALTNARKHAAGAPVTVTVHYGPPASTVDVRNPAGTPSDGSTVVSGYGLVGLAERVGGLGGQLEHGPSGEGGWRVTARIPLAGGAAPGPA
jgi:signal transduction histidine kinase